jgi:acyl-CoA synthetase (AMP-forming)/AMP-acid ligase II
VSADPDVAARAADAAASASAARTIPQLVVEAAERHGERVFLEEGAVRLSFVAFADEVRRAARGFLAAGLARGDRVAIWAPNRWEWVVAAAGAQMAGAVLVPLNTRLKGREAGVILRRSRARMLVTLGGAFLGTRFVETLRAEDLPHLERIVTLGEREPETQAWGEFVAAGAAVPESELQARAEAVTPSDLSDLLFTSGTTGEPKGVMTAHGQNLRAFAIWSDVVGLRAGDRYLVVNPFFHAFGYKAGWLACLLRGATVLPHAVFDVPAVLARIGRERITVLPGPPTLYQSILAHPERSHYDLSALRLAVTGAAAIPVELIRRMRETLGFETVITGYGLTEACGIVSMCRFDDDPETIATTSGRAIPGIEVRCVDGSGAEVPRGTPGEVVVRGYNVMQGYFEDPVATAETLDPDGWLHTGDIAVMDARGYLRITDRIKDMFIVGGFNCYPAEIENLLFGSGWFAAVAVVGVPDERLGEVGMATVVPAPGASFGEEDVIRWCRANMANYKVPRRVEIVDQLPVNAAGKVMKFVLRERAQGRAH